MSWSLEDIVGAAERVSEGYSTVRQRIREPEPTTTNVNQPVPIDAGATTTQPSGPRAPASSTWIDSLAEKAPLILGASIALLIVGLLLKKLTR